MAMQLLLQLKSLERCLAPGHLVLGDYEPMRRFFYDEVDRFHISKHKPIEQFLKNNHNDPVSIYFYLRWWSKYGKKDLVDDSIKELWYKRYLAELLIEFDCCLLIFLKIMNSLHSMSEALLIYFGIDLISELCMLNRQH